MQKWQTMKMAASLLVSGILLVALGIFVGRNIEKNWFPDSEFEKTGEENTATTTQGAKASTAANSAETPRQTCAEAARLEAVTKDTKYVEGNILVTFKRGIDFGEAKSFLDAKGLRVHTGARQEDFESNHWLTVIVPKGEEFDWICSLKTATEVTYAGLNPTFELAE